MNNTENNWVQRFLVKQNENISKARKSKLSVWGEATLIMLTKIVKQLKTS